MRIPVAPNEERSVVPAVAASVVCRVVTKENGPMKHSELSWGLVGLSHLRMISSHTAWGLTCQDWLT